LTKAIQPFGTGLLVHEHRVAHLTLRGGSHTALGLGRAPALPAGLPVARDTRVTHFARRRALLVHTDVEIRIAEAGGVSREGPATLRGAEVACAASRKAHSHRVVLGVVTPQIAATAIGLTRTIGTPHLAAVGRTVLVTEVGITTGEVTGSTLTGGTRCAGYWQRLAGHPRLAIGQAARIVRALHATGALVFELQLCAAD